MKNRKTQDLTDELVQLVAWEQVVFGETVFPETTESSSLTTPKRTQPEADVPEPLVEPLLKGGDPDPALPRECKTLLELRELCEQSRELHTDLEGTRLVFGTGNSDAGLMVIGEAPGYHEDQMGEPFVGKAGELLNKILEAIRFRREDVYIANILKHRPPDNRDPNPEEQARSLPFLMRQIELVDPRLILCLGRVSATTLLAKDHSLKSLRGRFHPFAGRELLVTYHPAALLRNPQWKRATWEDVQLLRRRYDQLQSENA